MRKDQFKRPDPGFSLYEGRTRGKRIKYTYSDDEDFLTDSTGPRRSTRNGASEPAGPTTTASGRLVRAPSRMNGGGVSTAATSVQGDGDMDMEEMSVGPTGRPRRSAAVHHGMNGWAQKKRKQQVYEDEFDSEANESEPDLGDDEEEDEEDDADEHVPEEEEDEDDEDEDKDAALDAEDEELEQHAARRSAVIKLAVSAVLDKETGKWQKTVPVEAKQGKLGVIEARLSPPCA